MLLRGSRSVFEKVNGGWELFLIIGVVARASSFEGEKSSFVKLSIMGDWLSFLGQVWLGLMWSFSSASAIESSDSGVLLSLFNGFFFCDWIIDIDVVFRDKDSKSLVLIIKQENVINLE